MATAAIIGVGVASGVLSSMQQSSASSAQARAARARNAAVLKAATGNYEAEMAQLRFQSGLRTENLSKQDSALKGALFATSAARGISGSRLASALQTNRAGQTATKMTDFAISDMLAAAQAETNFNNSVATGSTSYQAPSQGLMLLGAGLQGLQAGLSTYSAVGGWSTPATPTNN